MNSHSGIKNIVFFAVTAFLMSFAVQSASAQDINYSVGQEDTEPLTIEEAINLPKMNKTTSQNPDESAMPLDIRRDAMIEAAMSYGARAGLSWRTYHIRNKLEEKSVYLDKVYDFGQLLIPAPSGFMIEPPIISEALNSMIIKEGGTNAAITDKYLNIVENARIVSAPRNWRAYLERQWGEVQTPPDILRPENEEERAIWEEHIRKGWKKGVEQADEIFEQDLLKLESDYVGMVRYRKLFAQNMVSPPYALEVDRGVTGGGNEMRIGDREIRMTGVPELKSGYSEWKPANR